MNISEPKENKRIIPLISRLDYFGSSHRNHRYSAKMTKKEEKRMARDVIKKIMARIKRL